MCKMNDGSGAPDGGYGWIIVTCSIFINSCLLPLTQCFGVIYESQFQVMKISAAEISFLLHLNNCVMCSLGLISGPLLKRFNFQQVAYIGSTLICLGIFFSTFARTYSSLLLTIGVLIGCGQGILMPGLYIAVNSYFKKKLTLAISFQVTGASLSQIFMPQVSHYLLNQYGVQGTVLILFGISMNAFPAIFLLKPLPKPKPNKLQLEETSNNKNDEEHVSERLLLHSVYRETTVPAKNKQSKSKEIIKILDLGLFKDRAYVLIILGMGLSFVSELNVVLMMPFILAELANFTNQMIATAASIQAFADIVGRLFVPFISYKFGVHPKFMYIISLVGSSTGRLTLAYLYDKTNIVFVVSGIIGVSKGSRAVFQSVIIPKYVEAEKLPAATGLAMVTNGMLSLVIGPLIGLIHDIGNSYVYTLHTASIISSMCIVLWTAEYIVLKMKSVKSEQDFSSCT